MAEADQFDRKYNKNNNSGRKKLSKVAPVKLTRASHTVGVATIDGGMVQGLSRESSSSKDIANLGDLEGCDDSRKEITLIRNRLRENIAHRPSIITGLKKLMFGGDARR